VQEPTDSFLKRRLTKVVFPTLFWTFFYLAVTIVTEGMSMSEFINRLISIPFSAQGHSILWFMYTLIGLYLLSPIISPWLQKASKREIEWVLLLWGVTLCFPLLAYGVTINTSQTGILYYFGGYAGYFLLGYYLHTYRPKISPIGVALLFLIPLCTAVTFKFTGTQVDFYSVFWYQSIFTVVMCIGWFCIFQRLEERIPHSSWITLLSNCCFGIYLVHIFIMRSILWKCGFISAGGGIIQIILTILLTSLISFAIIWGISKLPYSQYVIGYKSKK
ncbi:MAG: acyltransferase family protein, partial [Prevotella sp.]|nr:acyltransferase family protein [Prevotella sp.]